MKDIRGHHQVCFRKVTSSGHKGNLLLFAHFSSLWQPTLAPRWPSGHLTPSVVFSSVNDSYPFHLVFNYTPTPQFTCPKLLQRKPTHSLESPWRLHFLFPTTSWKFEFKGWSLIRLLKGFCCSVCHSRLFNCICVWECGLCDFKCRFKALCI